MVWAQLRKIPFLVWLIFGAVVSTSGTVLALIPQAPDQAFHGSLIFSIILTTSVADAALWISGWFGFHRLCNWARRIILGNNDVPETEKKAFNLLCVRTFVLALVAVLAVVLKCEWKRDASQDLNGTWISWLVTVHAYNCEITELRKTAVANDGGTVEENRDAGGVMTRSNSKTLKQKDEELKQKDEELEKQGKELTCLRTAVIVLGVILAVIVLAHLRFQFPSVAGLCGTGGAQCCTGGPEKCPPSAFTPEKKKQYDEMKPNIKGNGAGGAPPASLVEFTLAKDKSGQDTYDTSYVDGYNEMTIVKPIEGTYDPAAKKPAEDNFCTKEDLKTAASTPKELKKPSETAPTANYPNSYFYDVDDKKSTFVGRVKDKPSPDYQVSFSSDKPAGMMTTTQAPPTTTAPAAPAPAS